MIRLNIATMNFMRMPFCTANLWIIKRNFISLGLSLCTLFSLRDDIVSEMKIAFFCLICGNHNAEWNLNKFLIIILANEKRDENFSFAKILNNNFGERKILISFFSLVLVCLCRFVRATKTSKTFHKSTKSTVSQGKKQQPALKPAT